MIKTLLVATTNPSKFREAVSILEEKGLKILGLKDFPSIQKVEEIGDSFLENALLKAKGYFNQTKIPCIADDGGLMIDYLHGAPGVNSHRWLGHEVSDQELAEAVLKKLDGVPRKKRTARLGGCVVFYNGKDILKQKNWVEGYIADKLMGDIKPGFPYRSVFIVTKFNKPFSEITEEEDREIGARQRNFRTLKPKVLELLK